MSRLIGAEDILSIEELLAHGVTTFFDNLVKDTLTEPDSPEARRTMMRAFALALRIVSERSPDSQVEMAYLKSLL